MPTSGKRLRAIALAAALFAAACGSTTTTEVASSEVESALSGEFDTLDGTSIDLGDLAGQDVVLWFWAPW